MTPRVLIYALIAVGFAGLIGGHEVTAMSSDPDANENIAFVLATIGTLAFVLAGVMAFRMLRGRQ
jgi:heme A synthase